MALEGGLRQRLHADASITGSGGASFSHGTRIAKIDLATCTTTAFRSLPNRYFGEGITVVGDRLYQLTWTSNVGFVYDKRSFELLDQFEYDHPGWGLTNDGTSLIVSDGSPYLYFYNPETFVQERKLLVRYLGRKSGEMTPLRRINDLQFVKGKVHMHVECVFTHVSGCVGVVGKEIVKGCSEECTCVSSCLFACMHAHTNV